MEETKYIWQDGQMKPWKEAMTHTLTHTLHYGGGAFEGVRAYETDKGPAIFRLQDHIKRLFYSCSVLEMEMPFTQDQINDAVIATVKDNEVQSCYIRPLVYFGYGKMGLNPTGAPVNAIVACWPWGAYLGGDKAIRVKTSKYIRIHPQSTVPDAKLCGNYVNSILASLEIKKAGVDEGLFLDYRGLVAEGPGENIFIVKNGKIATPKLGSILAGITRDSVMTLIKDLGMEVVERDVTKEELLEADELFFTGTAVEVQPIGELDGQKIGNGEMGPITTKLRGMYMDIVHGRNDKYINWLTFIK